MGGAASSKPIQCPDQASQVGQAKFSSAHSV